MVDTVTGPKPGDENYNWGQHKLPCDRTAGGNMAYWFNHIEELLGIPKELMTLARNGMRTEEDWEAEFKDGKGQAVYPWKDIFSQVSPSKIEKSGEKSGEKKGSGESNSGFPYMRADILRGLDDMGDSSEAYKSMKAMERAAGKHGYRVVYSGDYGFFKDEDGRPQPERTVSGTRTIYIDDRCGYAVRAALVGHGLYCNIRGGKDEKGAQTDATRLQEELFGPEHPLALASRKLERVMPAGYMN